MKKTLIAAALFAGFAGAAHAQSSVTLYGIVDAGLHYNKFDGAQSTVGIDSGNAAQSRWGIRGVEDLGNGLKAVFTLESAIAVDNGNNLAGGLFRREATVGLASNTAGELRMGRQTNLGFRWVGGLGNSFGLGYGGGKATNFMAYNNAAEFGGRSDNSIYYVSPNFSGFQFGAGYSFNVAGPEVPGSSNNNRLVDIGLRYSAGPLAVAAAYQQTDLAGAAPTAKNFQIAGSYDFGIVKAHLGFAQAKNVYNAMAWQTNANNKNNVYTMGVSAPLGAGRVMFAYNHVDHKTANQTRDHFQLGYTYDLSKRTQVYTFLGQGRYDVARVNDSAKEFALGLRHSF